MNRPPEPNYAAPLPQRRDAANHRQADLYRYDMETEGARIHVEVWLHEEITPAAICRDFPCNGRITPGRMARHKRGLADHRGSPATAAEIGGQRGEKKNNPMYRARPT